MAPSLESVIRSPRLRAVGAVLCAVLFGLLGVRLVQLWRDGSLDLADANWPVFVLAIAVAGAATTALGAVWAVDVRALGGAPPAGLVPVFYVGQLAKYLPGGAWQYVGRAGLAVRLGLPLRTAGASLVLETVCLLVALAPVAPMGLAIDPAGTAFAVTLSGSAVAAGMLAGRVEVARRWLRALLAKITGQAAAAAVRIAAVRSATVRYVGVWLVFGLSFWLTARSLVDAPVTDLPLYAGVFAIAWGAGFVVFFAPGGLGIREVVMVGLLGPRIGAADALMVAAASRVAFTIVDLVGGLGGLWALRRLPTRPAPT